jgi:hypothetical protein
MFRMLYFKIEKIRDHRWSLNIECENEAMPEHDLVYFFRTRKECLAKAKDTAFNHFSYRVKITETKEIKL